MCPRIICRSFDAFSKTLTLDLAEATNEVLRRRDGAMNLPVTSPLVAVLRHERVGIIGPQLEEAVFHGAVRSEVWSLRDTGQEFLSNVRDYRFAPG